MKHITIVVTGVVQGVYFRQSTLEIACRLGIKGFVRNEPEGNVYIEAEGSEAQLAKLTAWCRKGPSKAVVREVKVVKGELKNYSEFNIQR